MGKCCAWCSNLAGTYSYPDVPKDIYRRHENCRCTVEYDSGNSKRQDVHTKQWTVAYEADKIEARKRIGLETDFYGSPTGKIIPKKLADWIGDNKYEEYMATMSGEEAQKFIKTAYRKKSVICDGGTAAIRKMEKATGLNLGRNGNNHAQKVKDLIRQINKSLTKNVDMDERKFLLERLAELIEVND